MYNYIWVKRVGRDEWMRVHNFGVDVRAFRTDADRAVINTIGMDMDVRGDGNVMRVTYPNPLVQYRQFELAKRLSDIHNYPDIPHPKTQSLVHADASVEFTYEIDPERPSFTISGRVLEGAIANAVYIIDALWTDNHQLPTHCACETFPEYYVHAPDAALMKRTAVENAAYVIFYRADGQGLPFALLPLRPDQSMVYNIFNNWRCLRDFYVASTNQEFVPSDPPVTESNDTGYVATPDDDGTLRGVRVAFFPELGWGQGGQGRDLRAAMEDRIAHEYLDVARSWRRIHTGRDVLWTFTNPPPW